MSTDRDFLLCPWQADFMDCLLRQALADTDGDIATAVFIFPHSRPEKYLSRLLRVDERVKRPVIAPRCLTVSGLFSAFRARIVARSAWNAGLLDRVGLLLECVRQECGPDDQVFAQLLTDARHFFPWGVRLASLFEECLVQHRKPENFHNTGGQVSPFAEMLLARLARLFTRYTNGLAGREWTTPGFDASLAADWLLEHGQMPPGLLAGKAIYIAGFHMLAGSEEVLFRHLWEQRGARVMLHADPALADPPPADPADNSHAARRISSNQTERPGRNEQASRVHWSCHAFLDWAERWKTGIQPAPVLDQGDMPPDPAQTRPGMPPVQSRLSSDYPVTDRTAQADEKRSRIRYYEGFDLHSQLTVLERELAELAEGPEKTADIAAARTGETVTPESAEAAPAPAHAALPAATRDPADLLLPKAAPDPATEGRAASASDLGDDFSEDESARDQAADTVVVLPDSGLLMPVLHHLPGTNINISMGYPLSRSPLFRLLDTLARLQEGRRNEGYYWRDLVDLVRHPYIKMLQPLDDAPDSPQPGGSGPEPGRESSGLDPFSPSGETIQPYNDTLAGESPLSNDDARPNETPRAGEAALRRELYRLEQALHAQGRKYARPRELLEQAYLMLPLEEMPPRPVLALLDALLEVCLDRFEHPHTPDELGLALEGVCSLLLTHGGRLWKRFLIDAECLYRLMQSLIPELRHSRLAGEAFSSKTLFAMFRKLMEAERVPFEATPLVGLQVMGMLETRLLSFRRVVVLDAGEDVLPGAVAADPLLPEALRPELGLPPLHSREQVAAYHFFRLIAGAEDVVLLWQEGADSPGIQEGRKKKSRFIEELLWEEEKRLGRLLSPKEHGRDGPLTVLASAVAPLSRDRRGITVTPGIRALVRSLLERPVSASLLDNYLRCPVQFFYQRLARLAPAEEIREGDDPAAVGELFHQVLHDGYSQHPPGNPLPGGEELASLMGPELTATLHASPAFAALARTLPADSFATLACAGILRLTRYLEHQPPSTVLALESAMNAVFVWKDLTCTLTGKADRIDLRLFPPDPDREREEAGPAGRERNAPPAEQAAEISQEADEQAIPGIVILDYKTGRLPRIASDFWDNQTLWRRLRTWRAEQEPAPEDGDLLHELSRQMESVQLPMYLLLYSISEERTPPADSMGANGKWIPVLDAAWTALGESGEEKTLFPKHFSSGRRKEIVKIDIPDLLYFLMNHLLSCHEYLPHAGKHCDWCSCAKLCIVVRPLV